MADWSFNGGYRRKDGDFQEEDVWSVMERDQDDDDDDIKKSIAWRFSSPQNIPKKSANNNNSKIVQSSAPVNVPDWSKIYGKTNSWVHHNHLNNNGYGDNGFNFNHHHHHGVNDNDDDDDDGMVPPHEWIAKKLARGQISSFSVCEGLGRTLKGRDLSKVRNAILTKTGFLE